MNQDLQDENLINQFLRGNAEALGMLYDRHAQAVFRYLYGMVGQTEAEDLLQEVFIQAGRLLKNYEHRNRLRSWLFCLARSRALDLLRKHKRQANRAFSQGEEENICLHPASELDKQVSRETSRRIFSAVSQLPEKQREIFLMREEAGMSFKEISEALEIPLNTALSHMRRALGNLKVFLADLEGELD